MEISEGIIPGLRKTSISFVSLNLIESLFQAPTFPPLPSPLSPVLLSPLSLCTDVILELSLMLKRLKVFLIQVLAVLHETSPFVASFLSVFWNHRLKEYSNKIIFNFHIAGLPGIYMKCYVGV